MRLTSIAVTWALILSASTAAMAGGWEDKFDPIDDALKAQMDQSSKVAGRKQPKANLATGQRGTQQQELNGQIILLEPSLRDTLGGVDF